MRIGRKDKDPEGDASRAVTPLLERFTLPPGRVVVPLCSGKYRPLYRLRQSNRSKQGAWIEVVFAGLIDNPNKTMLLGSRIRCRNINLAPFKRRRITVVADTYDQLLCS